jgi:hypothetical protein
MASLWARFNPLYSLFFKADLPGELGIPEHVAHSLRTHSMSATVPRNLVDQECDWAFVALVVEAVRTIPPRIFEVLDDEIPLYDAKLQAAMDELSITVQSYSAEMSYPEELSVSLTVQALRARQSPEMSVVVDGKRAILFLMKKGDGDYEMRGFNIEYRKHKCHNCHEDASHKCATCKTAYYCTKECQKADWKEHKVYCSV